MLIQKEKNIVFSLIHFNLEIWIQFNFLIQIQMRCNQLKLHCENLFNVKSFKWTLLQNQLVHFINSFSMVACNSVELKFVSGLFECVKLLKSHHDGTMLFVQVATESNLKPKHNQGI
jgi:hypothetical protein